MKKPFVSRKQLEKIIAEYPTPFHLYDEKGIRETARALARAFSWNPGFREFFAVKATPTPAILNILKEEGCGCDCASLSELMLADRCGFRGESVMFSSNDTPEEEYLYAYEHGAVINLDDVSHIEMLKRILPSFPKKMSCRFNPGGVFTLGSSHEGFQVMDVPQEAKFGMTRDQIFEAFRLLKDLGVREFGMHAFLASNTLSDEYYPSLAAILFQLAADLTKETGCRISFINLSGGIGIPYRPEDRSNDIYAIGEGVRKAYEKILKPAGMDDVAVCTELGRFMLGPSGCLVSRVRHIKHTYRDYAGIDACSADLMRPAMYGAYHHITVMGKENEPCDHVYDVTGSLCENNDRLAVQRKLPLLEEGDLIVIHDTGAHGHAMGFNYNGKLRSAEILLCADGSFRLIRRAETPEDYFRTMIF